MFTYTTLGDGVAALRREERPVPAPGPSQLLVRMRAATLNYRDLLVVNGVEHWKPAVPRVPVSDGVGVVEAVGAGVARWREGDRVAGLFLPHWQDGELTPEKGAGPRLSGGTPTPLDGDATLLVTPQNLTPDPKTGHLTNWTEEQFVARFRQGKTVEGSHMPWGPFGRMSDDDLRAIYRYLMSLDPVERDTGPILRKNGDA